MGTQCDIVAGDVLADVVHCGNAWSLAKLVFNHPHKFHNKAA